MSVCYDYKTKHYYIDAKILLKNGKYKHVSYRENFNDNFKSKKYVASIEYRVIEELKNKANREFAIDDLNSLYDRYYKTIESERADNTLKNLDSIYNKFIKTNFTKLNDLFDLRKLENFRIFISNEKIVNAYKNKILTITKELIKYARKIKLIDSDTKDDCLDVLERLKQKVEGKKEPRNKYTSLEDFKKIIALIEDENLKDTLTLLYFSGLRVGEFLGIKVSDIEFNEGIATINIERQKLRSGTISTRLKTTASYKKIAYVGENIEVLKSYIKRNNLKENDFLFMVSREMLRRYLIKYCKLANVSINTIHGFGRKSINTELYLHGADTKVRKTLLGQTSEDVNETNYTDNETAFNKGVEILKSLN